MKKLVLTGLLAVVSLATLHLAGPKPVSSDHAALAQAAVIVVPDSPVAMSPPAARSHPTELSGVGQSVYDWPTGSVTEVLRPFAPPEVRWGAGHRGVDLDHPTGTAVLAAADGIVAFAGVVVDRPVISIDHADGVRTTYEPVEPSVSRGEVVARGQEIGILAAGHAPRGGLHWGARVGNDYIDPLSLLGIRPVRLYPLESD